MYFTVKSSALFKMKVWRICSLYNKEVGNSAFRVFLLGTLSNTFIKT